MQGTGHPPESPPDEKTAARVDLAVQTPLGALGLAFTPSGHLGLRLPSPSPQQARLPMGQAVAMFPPQVTRWENGDLERLLPCGVRGSGSEEAMPHFAA